MSKKFVWKKIGKIIAAISSIAVGLAIGGNVLYNEGLYTGGERIYNAGCEIYDDFQEKMADYANEENSEENENL